jgi:hypothetical protein
MRRSASSKVGRLFVQVARLQPEIDAALLAFDHQAAGAGEGRRQRLRAAHAAQAGRENPASGRSAPEVAPAGLDEGLVGALHDALAADVDPGAGGHLAEHHQALAIELVKCSQVAQCGTRLELAISTRGASSWVRKTPTGLPDWINRL